MLDALKKIKENFKENFKVEYEKNIAEVKVKSEEAKAKLAEELKDPNSQLFKNNQLKEEIRIDNEARKSEYSKIASDSGLITTLQIKLELNYLPELLM